MSEQRPMYGRIEAYGHCCGHCGDGTPKRTTRTRETRQWQREYRTENEGGRCA